MRHVRMTVGALRELIEGVADDVPILVPASDHGYLPANVKHWTAVFDKRSGWSEDFGTMNPEQISDGDIKDALIVSGE